MFKNLISHFFRTHWTFRWAFDVMMKAKKSIRKNEIKKKKWKKLRNLGYRGEFKEKENFPISPLDSFVRRRKVLFYSRLHICTQLQNISPIIFQRKNFLSCLIITFFSGIFAGPSTSTNNNYQQTTQQLGNNNQDGQQQQSQTQNLMHQQSANISSSSNNNNNIISNNNTFGNYGNTTTTSTIPSAPAPLSTSGYSGSATNNSQSIPRPMQKVNHFD